MSNATFSPFAVDLLDSFVVRQIRRCNRNLLLVNAISLAAIVLCWAGQSRYFYNFAYGPLPADSGLLLSTANPSKLWRYFITYKPEELVATGVNEVERETDSANNVKRETIEANYYIASVGDRLLIVKLPAREAGSSDSVLSAEIAGSVEPVPQEVLNTLVAPYEKNRPELRKEILPVMLDGTSFRDAGYVELVLLGPLLALNIWNIRKALGRQAHPETHPMLVRLSKYGSIDCITREIERELAAPAVRLGNIIATEGWLLVPVLYLLLACPFREVAWSYQCITQHSVNFIPSFKAYGVMVWDRHKQQFSIPCKAADAGRLLDVLRVRSTQALFGYSKELEAKAKRNWPSLLAAAGSQHAGIRPL